MRKVAGKEKEIARFMEDNIDRISNLENAYITSVYIPSEFERKEVENMLEIAGKIRGLVDSL
ncbi:MULTISPECIES: HEPN domain-containing protein [unclassified Archaeoglobus]|uniref:HEPN domain-containing protein n=1 Tax=unclassified Archaeoglobus TaxID=2643606 RepID=UPI0025C6BEAA|nr:MULTISPECIES: HEPN domain-containing protein [unclassified Archaeoglobus]